MTEEQEKLFRADPLIKILLETEGLNSVKLVGGAVSDILEGRVPKDYDFEFNYFPDVDKLGLEYQYETKTAKTFKKEDLIIQQLKTTIAEFDFKISQSVLSIPNSKKIGLTLDKNSFDNKVLIPTDICWIEKKKALNALRRVVHWRNKGYTISDMTYLSLLSVVAKNNNYNS